MKLMRKEHWRDWEAEQHVVDVCAAIRGHDGFVAVGLDMAADEDNWGLAVLLLGADLRRAQLALLLPRLAMRVGGKAAARIRLLPSAEMLRPILAVAQEGAVRGSLAVDVPIGWPVEHAEFTTAWSATASWRGSDLPDRARFELRCCDRQFREMFPGVRVFPLGGDSIAQAAFVWATQLHALRDLAGAVDVGLGEATTPLRRVRDLPCRVRTQRLPYLRRLQEHPGPTGGPSAPPVRGQLRLRGWRRRRHARSRRAQLVLMGREPEWLTERL